MIINDVPIISVKGNYCSVHFCYMSEYEAMNVLENDNFPEKKWNIIKLKWFFLITF